ncbi:MAG: hypothetical protein WC993_11825, partial [Methanoculleus sp.]
MNEKTRQDLILRFALTLLVILALNFFLPRMMPGDPFSAMSSDVAGEDVFVMTEEQREYYSHYYGLDLPLHEQFAMYL